MLPSGLGIADIPENGSKGFECNGERYFAVKKLATLYVYKNSCPHTGISLEWTEDQFLDASRTMIQCANHGALFVIESGVCVAGPCNGRKLKAVSFQLVDEQIFLTA